MGDLLEALDRRFEERYGQDWDSDYKLTGWDTVHVKIGRSFQPTNGEDEDLHPDGTYVRWYSEELKGVLEMFRDVYLSVLSTIPVAGGYTLAIEPHLSKEREPTKIIITYGGKVLYTHSHLACYFDFDDSHMLEVFMRSVRDTIKKNLGY